MTMTAGRPTLILFTKAPRWGTVKRRLAASIGPREALRFHRAQLRRLIRDLGADPRWRIVLAITPDDARGPWTGGLSVMGQGSGTLGQRMARCLEAVTGGGPRVLIGSDIPGITTDHIARAFALLARHDVVFGPAEDGGFWLVGLAGRRPVPGLFQGARWSSPHTLADCLTTVRNRRVALTATLADVDEAP